MICDIDRAITDPQLLGAALGDIRTWAAWRAILKAAFALKLSDSELADFKLMAGGREPPRSRVSELWVIAGRRGGKSRMAAAISAYLGTFADNGHKLAAGEIGHVLCLAPSKDQARIVQGFAEGHFAASPILRQELLSSSASELRLKNNITLGVHTNSFRTVRGRTLLAAVFDEVAFWRDEASASPDIEVYRAVLPALASTGGMLVAISTAYRRVGLLYQKHRDHFGENNDEILVIQAPTEKLNPLIDQRIIARAKESDPEAALAEWDAEFRNDLSSLLDDADLDRAIVRGRPMELPPQRGTEYFAFTDASAARRDSFTCAIAHKDKDQIVVDLVRGRRPPFDPREVAAEYSKLAREYGCQSIVGDAYAGEWTAGAFRDCGIAYRKAEKTRSELYLEMLPVFARAGVSIPNHPTMIRELRLLERRTSRSGKDSIDHPQNGSDDYANSLAGVLYECSKRGRLPPPAFSMRATYTGNTQSRSYDRW
jgi:hypothetical protein